MLGLGAAVTFALTLLGEIDQTLGLASGSAAGATTAVIFGRYLNVFRVARSSVVDRD